MKNVKYLIFLLSIGMLFSCGKKFLDEAAVDPSSLGGVKSYNTIEKIGFGVNGCYEALYDIYKEDGMPRVLERRSENAWNNSQDNDNIHDFSLSNGGSGEVNTCWNENYVMVGRCNILLEAIQEFGATAESNVFKGEVLFLRGLAYYNLVRMFGNIPLVLKPAKNDEEAFEYGQSTPDVVLDSVIADLEVAVDLLPVKSDLASSELNRATKGAAQTLLGDALIMDGQYSAAATELLAVINSGEYELLTDYEDNFFGAENSDECVFQVDFKFPETQGLRITRWAPWNLRDVVDKIETVTGWCYPTDSIQNLFRDSADVRDTFSFHRGAVNSETGIWHDDVEHFVKFTDKDNAYSWDVNSSWNWVVLRYAHTILLYAEAQLGLGNVQTAMENLNLVRERVGMPPRPTTGLTVAEAMDLLQHERLMEFCGEAHRWFDLIRASVMITDYWQTKIEGFLQDVVESDHILFPIPNDEIEQNEKFFQNPGY